jgi:hypothetical protein
LQTCGYLTTVLLVLALIAVFLPAVILLGVRVRLHDGGGREAGICVRRVAVGRGETGEASASRFRKTSGSRLPSERGFENAGR